MAERRQTRPGDRDGRIPGIRRAMIAYTRELIAAYGDTSSLAYQGLVFHRRPQAVTAKHRVYRLGELLERLESAEPVRVRSGSIPPEYRRRLPVGTPLDYYIITADDEVSLEERVSSR